MNSQRCICLPSAGIKGVRHLARQFASSGCHKTLTHNNLRKKGLSGSQDAAQHDGDGTRQEHEAGGPIISTLGKLMLALSSGGTNAPTLRKQRVMLALSSGGPITPKLREQRVMLALSSLTTFYSAEAPNHIEWCCLLGCISPQLSSLGILSDIPRGLILW